MDRESKLVEAAGIEPASAEPSALASTSLARLLFLLAQSPASGILSETAHIKLSGGYVSAHRHAAGLSDALSSTAGECQQGVPPSIRQPEQQARHLSFLRVFYGTRAHPACRQHLDTQRRAHFAPAIRQLKAPNSFHIAISYSTALARLVNFKADGFTPEAKV